MTDTLTPLTSAELADLKAKAKGATPGPWYYVRHSDHHFINGKRYSVGVCYGQTEEVVANAALITGANPETILRLIDMVERLQSDDHKREIENAAYERAAKLVDDVGEERRADLHDPEVEVYAATQLLVCERIAEDLRALITPAKTADTEG